MESLSAKDLIDSGVHFGCRTREWNPKMKPYIHGKRHTIHIIDVEQTLKGLIRAQNFLSKLVATGAQVVFVGTKRQVRSVIENESKRCSMPHVIERWIGGTLTNYAIIRKRLQRLEELETLEATGEMEQRYSKKIVSSLRRERMKIARNLQGIRTLTGLPGALVVVDPNREEIAVKEARKMGIPTVCLLDTDCDPDYADIAIPGNDDAMKSVQLIISRLADAVLEGREMLRENQAIAQKSEAEVELKPGSHNGKSSGKKSSDNAEVSVGAREGSDH